MALAPRFTLFRLLNGLAAFYKPPNTCVDKLVSYLKRTLSEDFNALTEEPNVIRTIIYPSDENPSVMKVMAVPDLVHSKFVVGRTFYPGDFMIYPIDPLDDLASGVQVFGIGEDGVHQLATQFEKFSWIKTYHLTGMLGRASVDGTPLGSTLLRSSWRHVTRHKLDRVLAGLEAQFRSSALLQAGLRHNTQAAYVTLASRVPGQDLRASTPKKRFTDLQAHEHLLPPWERHRSLGAQLSGVPEQELDEDARRQTAPFVHSIKCIQFEPPYFTLELRVSCETFSFLVNLVAGLGPRLRSTSLLSRARRVRHGRITAEHALLFKHCRVPAHLVNRLSELVHRELTDSNEPSDLSEATDRSSLLESLVVTNDSRESPNLFTNLHICTQLGLAEKHADSAHHLLPTHRSLP